MTNIYYVPEVKTDKTLAVAKTMMYVNDTLEGDAIEYFENGKIKSKTKYVKGLKEGVAVINHPAGNPMMKENYVHGAKQGYQYAYDISGKEIGKVFYRKESILLNNLFGFTFFCRLAAMKACLLIFSIVSVSALFFFGCKKNEEVDFHTDYYPVKKGKYIIYQVQDIVIDQGVDQYDTTNVFIKAIIGDTFIDNEGRVANRYERWFGPTASGPWTLVDIWTTIVANNRAELVEENDRKIKLVFAPTEYKTWNANAYNTLNDQDCYYSDLHVPFSIGGYDFDSTVTVLQDYTTPNLIEYSVMRKV
jgi:hypothetical protein